MLASFQSLLLRSSRSLCHSQMKLMLAPATSTAAVLAALAVTSRYSCSIHAFTTISTRAYSIKRPFGTVLNSAVAPDEEVSSSVTIHHEERIVADGTIVSYFRGGLAAVQISEDVLQSGEESNQSNDLIGHQVQFPNDDDDGGGRMGVVVAQRPPMLFVYTQTHDKDNNNKSLMENKKVQILNSKAQVQVTDDMTMVDCFGKAISTSTTDHESSNNDGVVANRDIFAAIPKLSDISLINSPMLTGETMIDALAPIGRGQNMLVVGSNFNQMRGLATDMLSTQIKAGTTKCIYAITHDTQAALERLKNAGILEDVIVVSVCNTSADPVTKAAEATAVAATACAIGEAFAHNEGKNSLVIVDSIDDFKILWDATTRVLVSVFGVDSVVEADRNGGASSEMRGFYSALIQRAGQFKESKGGGSVTLALLTSIPGNDGIDESTVHAVEEFDDCSDKIKARLDVLVKKNIPLTAANLRKIDIPIPSVSEGQKRLVLQHIDDLISMSDGQIWFDEKLSQQGQEPPMDPQKSITRIGIGADTTSRADAPAVRRMVEGLRLDLSQAASMDGAEANVASSKQLRKRNAWLLAMHQEPGQGGRTLAESCIALLAASTGALDNTIEAGGLAGTDKGQSTIRDLIAHVHLVAPDAVNEINDTLDSSPTRRAELVDAINSFFSSSV